MPKKIAYLILSTGPESRFKSLSFNLEKVKNEDDVVFTLLDVTESGNKAAIAQEGVIPFSINDLIKLEIPFFNTTRVNVGNAHFPLIWFYQKYPEFDYYWLIEDDVRFTGDYSNFFEDLNSNNHDFITGKIRRYREMPSFFMWDWIKFNEREVSVKVKLWSFSPIYRISNEGLKQVFNYHQTGWKGHMELIVPTVINICGLTQICFGGKGEFVPKKYENKYFKRRKNHSVETHRYRPPHLFLFKKNMIHHPVKPIRATLKIYWRMIVLKWKAMKSR